MSFNRRGESGNVFFTLFGAVALVGVIGVATTTLMKGPVGTVVTLNQKAKIESQLQIARKLVALDAAQRVSPAPDCDDDGTIEPMNAYLNGTCATLITGGGCLPQATGAAKIDPWGTQVGYCAWDHATQGGSADQYDGTNAQCDDADADTRPLLPGQVGVSNQPVLAVISAGANRTFETVCNNGGPANTDYAYKPSGSDDIVYEWTYEEAATGVGGGLWTLMSGNDAITTANDVEFTQDATFNSGVAFENNSSASFNTGSVLDLTGGGLFRLPDQTTSGVCGAANESMLRIDTTAGQTLQICDPAAAPDWTDIGGSGAASSVAGVDGDIQFNSNGALWADSAFQWDVDNDRLLIGSPAAPNDTVEIEGTVGISSDLNVQGIIEVDAGGAAAPGYTFTSANNTGFFLDGSGDVGITVGGTQVVDVTSTGIVVAGDVNVDDILFVSSDAFFDSNIQVDNNADVGGVLFNSNGDLTVGDVLNVTSSAKFASNGYFAGALNANRFYVDGTLNAGNIVDGDDGMESDGSGGIGLLTAGTRRLHIDSAGDIGIGVTGAPTATLDINGMLRLRNNSAIEAGDACTAQDGSIVYGSGDRLLLCSSMTGFWETIGATGGGGGGTVGLWERAFGAIQPIEGHGVDDFAFGNQQPETSGTFMFFDKSKGAFRVGLISDNGWTDARRGAASFAAGADVIAEGDNAIALGHDVFVDGAHSFGFGLGSAGGASPIVGGQNSFGIFMGDQSGINLATDNVMLLAGGRLVIDPDTTSASNIAPTNGLTVDVEGSVGAMNFCNEDGTECFTAADIASGATGAPGNNREILYNSNGDMAASAGLIFSSSGGLGLNVLDTATRLDVGGTMKMAYDGEACDATREGGIHYNSSNDTFYVCRTAGQPWQALAAGAAAAAGGSREVQFNSGGYLATLNNFVMTTTGRLGVLEDTPLAPLHVGDASGVGGSAPTVVAARTGDQPFMMFIDEGNDSSAIGISADDYMTIASENSQAGIRFRVNGDYGTEYINTALVGMTLGSDGRLNVGTGTAGTQLAVEGTITMAYDGEACDATREGGIQYNSSTDTFYVCRTAGAGWQALAAGASTAAGADRQVQFNSGGLLAGNANFTYNAAGTLGVNGTFTATAAGNNELLRSVLTHQPSGAESGSRETTALLGLISVPAPSNQSINSSTGIVAGAENLGTGAITRLQGTEIFADNTGAAAIDSLTGINTHTYTNAGTVNFMTAINGYNNVTGAGATVNSLYGVRTRSDISGGATVTNRYGLLLETQSGAATNDWGFYQQGTQPNRLGGYLGVGTAVSPAVPATQLDVAGTIKMAYDGEACDATREGGIQYNSSNDTFYVCRTAGAGWQALAAGASTAAGSDRQVQFNSGGLLEANSGLVYTSAGRLGLNTASPQGTLHVSVQGGGLGTNMASPVTANSSIRITGAGVETYIDDNTYLTAGSNFNIGVSSVHDVIMYTSGTERARIQNDGTFGIGRAVPSTQLDVDGTMRMAYDGEACDATREGGIQYNSSTDTFYVCRTAGAGWQALAAGTAVAAGLNREIQFNSGGTFGTNANFVFGSSGLLGIGTNNPNQQLHIANAGGQAGLRIEGDGTFNDVIWSVASLDTGDIWQWDLRGNSAGDYGNYNLNHYDAATTSWRSRISIRDDGRVGIGMGAANTQLEVDGTLRIAYDGEACDATREGSIHYSSSADEFYACKTAGGGWQALEIGTTITAAVPNRGIQFNSGGAFFASSNLTYTSEGDFVIGSYQIEDTGTGSEDNRMYFDVSKGAFRAGSVTGTEWNYSSTGNYSAAFGRDTEAFGQHSFAAGNSTGAYSESSVAMGFNSYADVGVGAIAMGNTAYAEGVGAVAMGHTVGAYGDGSVALGRTSYASGARSVAIGYEADAGTNALNSVAIGHGATTRGDNAVAIGEYAYSSATNALTLSTDRATVSGAHSIAMGSEVTTSGSYSMALGLANMASNPVVSGNNSFGIFMNGQTSAVNLAAANTMGLFGGRLLIDPRAPATNLTGDTALEVEGSIKMTYGGEACDAAREGALHYNSSTDTFFACQTAGGWTPLATGSPTAASPSRGIQFNSGGAFTADALLTFSTTGHLQIGGGLALTGDQSPATLTANTNDYAPANFATTSVLRLATDASRDLTGIAGGSDGRVVTILNVGSNPLVLRNDVTSTEANRFLLGADLTLAANQSLTVVYDSTSSRWRPMSSVSAGGVGSSIRFTSLTDAPSSYASQALRVVRVNAAATGLEFTNNVIETVGGIPAPTGFNLDDLANVNAPSPNDGYCLKFTSATGLWETGACVSGPVGPWTINGNDIYYNSSGTPRVGIGNAAPTQALDVTGTVRASVGLQLGLTAGAAAPTYLALDDISNVNAASPTAGHVLTYSGGNWISAAPTGGGGGGFWTAGAGDDIYYNSGASNVGIGNTNPTEALDVTGNIKLSGGLQLGLMTGVAAPGGLSLDNLTDVLAPAPSAGQVLLYSGGNWIPGTASGSSTAGGSSRQVQFNSGGALAADTNFVYTATGRLGIGNAAPTEALHVTGNLRVTQALKLDAVAGAAAPAGMSLDDLTNVVAPSASAGQVLLYSGGNWIPGTASGGSGTPAGSTRQIQFNSGGAFSADTNLVYTATGRVGIGNAAPTEALDVTGTVRASQSLQLGLVTGAAAPTVMNLDDLGNVDAPSPSAGHVLTYSGGNWVSAAATGGGGGGSFIGLTDVPAAFTGAAGRVVKVNSSEDALEFATSLFPIVTGEPAPVGIMLSQLDDVSVYNVADGDVLMYSAGANGWVPGVGGGGGGGTELWTAGTGDDIYYNSGTAQVGIGNNSPVATLDVTGTVRISEGIQLLAVTGAASPTQLALDDLQGVNAPSPTAGHVLTYSGGNWISAAASGGTPAGADTQIQFNSGGSFAASSALTFNSAGQLGVGHSTQTTTRMTVGNYTDWNPYAWKRGAYFYAGAGNSSASYNSTVALEAIAETQVTGAGASESYGISSQGQTANDAKSQTAVGVSGAYTIHNTDIGYALMAVDNNNSTGGTGYGLYINLDDTDVTRWGLYQVSDNNNYLRGNLGINNTSPGVALDVTGSIEYTGTITDVSDMRLKTDIHPLRDGGSMLEKVGMIDTYTFRMKDDMARREYGVMAQELEKVFPELVHTADDEMGTKSVNYVGLIAPMIEATKELKAENDNLRAEITALRAERDEIKTALNDLATDVKGLKAHTGYGINRAEMGLWMLLIALASGSLVLLLGGIVRNRQHKAE